MSTPVSCEVSFRLGKEHLYQSMFGDGRTIELQRTDDQNIGYEIQLDALMLEDGSGDLWNLEGVETGCSFTPGTMLHGFLDLTRQTGVLKLGEPIWQSPGVQGQMNITGGPSRWDLGLGLFGLDSDHKRPLVFRTGALRRVVHLEWLRRLHGGEAYEFSGRAPRTPGPWDRVGGLYLPSNRTGLFVYLNP